MANEAGKMADWGVALVGVVELRERIEALERGDG
jgi:hypothetical protein